MIGKKLDKYEIVRELGTGGMGAVFEARHVTTARRVAIKVILGELRADDSLILRFQREARAAGSIESRHIAQVLDAGKDPETGAPYLVMELLRGKDLDQLFKSGLAPFRPELALRIVAQALAGLERAHAASVIHRDIKPANLFIAESDAGQRVVKLVDFGIAKVKDDVTASREFSLTQTASLLGSPLYMSPEQARTSKSVDGRADIWSLGTVLYQMLTGDAPHGQVTSLTELLLAICTEPAKPVQDVAPWVAPEIARIVARSLEIDPSRRFGGAGEMLARIAEIVPDWQNLDEGMFTPLTDEEKQLVAERATPAWDVGTSTGSGRTTSLDLGLAPPSSPLAKTAVHGTALVESAVSSSPGTGTGTLADGITSQAGANAVSAPGAVRSDGLASTNRGDDKSPVGGRSRSVVVAVAVGAVALASAVGIGVKMRGTTDGPPAGGASAAGVAVTGEPRVSAPTVAGGPSASSAPSASPPPETASPPPETTPATSASAPVMATASGARTSGTTAPRPSAPGTVTASATRPPTTTAPATATPTTPHTATGVKPTPKASATSSASPISREFN